MSLYFLMSSIFIVLYLTIQTISDVKTKQVYTNLNYAAMIVVGLMYVVKCVSFGGVPQIQYFVGSFFFLAIHSLFLRKIMGTGDAKALVVMYYQSSLMFNNTFNFDLFFVVFIYFLANVFFSMYAIGNGIKKKKKLKDIFLGKERHAFFPFLLPAYIVGILIWVISMPRTI